LDFLWGHEVDFVDDDDLRMSGVSDGADARDADASHAAIKTSSYVCKLQLVGQQVYHASLVVFAALPLSLFQQVASAPIFEHAGAVDYGDLKHAA